MSEISSLILWRRFVLYQKLLSPFFSSIVSKDRPSGLIFFFWGLCQLPLRRCDVTSPPLLPFLLQFIEPCRSDRWTAADMRLYLTHYTNSAHILDTFKWVTALLFCQICQAERWHQPCQGNQFPRGWAKLKIQPWFWKDGFWRTNQ